MATILEELPVNGLRRRLRSAGCGPVSRSVLEALHLHYEELRRWAAQLALVGAGEAESIVERHYAQSLRALPLLEGASRVVDLGSGAGFPGWVLAAARPDLRFWLIEARARKASFLRTATARAQLSCHIVEARVARHQPITIALGETRVDVVTVRAVRLDRDVRAGLTPGLAPAARLLRWQSAGAEDPWPRAVAGRAVELPAAGGRIQEWHGLAARAS